jgi:hypothetical protein
MTYYLIEPEVAGILGENTVLDASTHPPRVDRLEYEIKGWMGDELMTRFPCFVVTQHLGGKLREAGLGAFQFRDVQVTMSPEGESSLEFKGIERFPECEWMHVRGTPGRDDFGVTSFAGDLVVSDRGLEALRQGRLEHAHIEEYDPAVHK